MDDPRKPDTVKIAVTRADGGLTMLAFVTAQRGPGGIDWTKEPNEENINACIAKYGWVGDLAPVSWRIVPDDFTDEATDRTYRNAWKDDGAGKPGHDMVKARELHRVKLRKARLRFLDALDIEYQKADEVGDIAKKQTIAREKQRLRDITADPRIEAAQTIEELKQVTI